MPTKKGAGGKQQQFDKATGQYGSETAAQLSDKLKQEKPKDKVITESVDELKKKVQQELPDNDYVPVVKKINNLKTYGVRKDVLSASDEKTTKEEPLSKVDSKNFRKAIVIAKETNISKERWKVDTTHNEEFYNECKCFVGLGGCTVAVVKDGENAGNIISVCKNQNTKSRRVLQKLLECAIKNGGDRLDAFGEGLFNKYQKYGFEPVSWTPFNTKYAPDGWKPQYGAKKNPIIFYRYVGEGKTTNLTFQDFVKNTQPFVGDNGYREAEKYRNDEIKKYGKKSNNV